MLSDSVMTSQGSGFAASSTLKLLPSKISAPNDADSSEAQQVQRKDADIVYSSGISMNIEKKEFEINGESFIFGYQTFKALKVLFEGINTYVSSDKLCVAVYDGKDGYGNKISLQAKCPIHRVAVCEEDEDWDKTSLRAKCPIDRLFYRLRNKIPDYIRGTPKIGYKLSNSVDMTSQDSDPSVQKRMKPTDGADSSEAFESEEDGGNLQKIQYDKKIYPLISDCYTDDYDQFVKDNESIRSRYIKVWKSPGFVRIGEIYISFRKNKVMIDGSKIFLHQRETQVLRFLALWYPNVVPYEQIYYNLSFGVGGGCGCSDENPEMKKHYITRLVSRAQARLRSGTDGILISNSYGEGYKLVCYSNRQVCPNESSVQDTLHSQSTGSSS
jgi:DNA-binding winged helix-turn-helix (wHTH) protein